MGALNADTLLLGSMRRSRQSRGILEGLRGAPQFPKSWNLYRNSRPIYARGATRLRYHCRIHVSGILPPQWSVLGIAQILPSHHLVSNIWISLIYILTWIRNTHTPNFALPHPHIVKIAERRITNCSNRMRIRDIARKTYRAPSRPFPRFPDKEVFADRA